MMLPTGKSIIEARHDRSRHRKIDAKKHVFARIATEINIKQMLGILIV